MSDAAVGNGPFLDGSFSKRLLHRRLAYGRRLKPLLNRRPVQLFLDGCCASAAVFLTYGLRFNMRIPAWAWSQMWFWAALLFFIDPLVLSTFGGYRSTWQFFGLRDFGNMARRLGALNVVLLLVPLFSPQRHLMPYSIVVVDLFLVLLLSGSIRLLRRLDHEALLRLSVTHRILIVGTSNTIAGAIKQLAPLYGAGLCGAVTDEDWLLDRRILGVPVLGNAASLGSLIHSHRISLLFLSSGDLRKMPELMQVAADFDVPVKFLPSVHDLIDNRVRVSKNVTVAALRKQKEAEALELHPAVVECLRGRTVLVTGAGGSIGSELVRQVAGAPIAKLILLDQDENAIFELLAELGQRSMTLQPVIADIRDREALRHVFAIERPQVVLHAAAYKHVPMMEANPCEAVLNNVCGTRTLAEAAMEFGAERLVMISSDKAVRPSSIMGATKRLAEVVVQQIANAADDDCKTGFACVRFGNVLGSRGSVLPMFIKQIEQGGPVTVTHEEMTRYFMTIPQAVNLVLQAATLASCGHVYMLDMGDPVRILSFAREVVQLAGLTPDKDIEIKIVGSRPGEKLHEQLWGEGADVSPTMFKHIFRVLAETPDSSFPALLGQLEQAAHEHRPESIRGLLRQLPIDYLTERPSIPREQMVESAHVLVTHTLAPQYLRDCH
jgi:FlaA1/EpsC-like NDP-sugar epimerase